MNPDFNANADVAQTSKSAAAAALAHGDTAGLATCATAFRPSRPWSLCVTLMAATALAIANVAQAQPSGPTNAIVLTGDYLSQISEQMRTNHPALRAANARTAAAVENVNTVRTWEDPMVSVGGMAAREMMRADDGDLIYGVDQKLPLFGKPQLARRVAKAEALTETASAEYEFQRLRADFARAAFRTALANEVITIGLEDLAWLEVISQTTDAKYRSSQASLAEVLQVQNERDKRTTTLQTDRDLFAHEQ
ncbi:MAG: TolC family protein, partial [Akkermansiaceae bacterium]|nr:TolC family protein [Verrucomicrobiales bacterium]